MRLLIVTHFFPEHRGGIEIVAGELARRLARDSIDIRWAASDNCSTSGAPGPVPMRSWNVAEDHLGFPYPLWSMDSLRRLRHLIAWCDVLQLHDSLYQANFIAQRIALRMRKPVVVTQHIGEVPYKNPLLRGLLKTANRTVARRVMTGSDRCVFISPRVRDYFSRFVRFRTPPLYWPNGVDTGQFQPVDEHERFELRRKHGWPTDRPVFLFAGRFVEKKGLLALREVARELTECDFVFAGRGPLDPKNWGLANVCCSGSLGSSALAEHYQAADLLVLPSVGEGFPLVVQEAAACGTPALISRETAIGHDEVRPFTYVSEPDPASVLLQLRLILNKREDLHARRTLAATFAHANWDWEQCTQKYRTLFEELSSRGRRRR